MPLPGNSIIPWKGGQILVNPAADKTIRSPVWRVIYLKGAWQEYWNLYHLGGHTFSLCEANSEWKIEPEHRYVFVYDPLSNSFISFSGKGKTIRYPAQDSVKGPVQGGVQGFAHVLKQHVIQPYLLENASADMVASEEMFEQDYVSFLDNIEGEWDLI